MVYSSIFGHSSGNIMLLSFVTNRTNFLPSCRRRTEAIQTIFWKWVIVIIFCHLSYCGKDNVLWQQTNVSSGPLYETTARLCTTKSTIIAITFLRKFARFNTSRIDEKRGGKHQQRVALDVDCCFLRCVVKTLNDSRTIIFALPRLNSLMNALKSCSASVQYRSQIRSHNIQRLSNYCTQCNSYCCNMPKSPRSDCVVVRKYEHENMRRFCHRSKT